MKYKFRLQKLLDLRKEKEEKSKVDFKKAKVEKNKVEDRLLGAKETYEKYRVIDGAESVIQKKMRISYLNALNNIIDEVAVELKKKEKLLEQKRSELEKRQIERKTVEILKDKKESAYYKEQQLIEQKTTDELALYAFIRKHREGR